MHNVSFDLYKFIFAIFIVITHSMGRYAGYPFIRIAVPMFFFMSGYLYFDRIKKSNNINEFQYYWHYTKRILLLYLTWFIVLLPHLLFTRGWFSNGYIRGLGILTVRFILNSTFTGSWYLSAVIIGIGILHFITKKIPDILVLTSCFIIYSLCCLASNYRGLFNEEGLVFFCIYKFPGTFYNSFPVGLIWLLIGKILANNHFSTMIYKKRLLLGEVAISTVLLLAEHIMIGWLKCSVDNDCYFMLVPLVFFIGALAVLYDFPGILLKYPPSFYKKLRNASTVVFCSHGAFLALCKWAWVSLGINAPRPVVGMMSCAMACILGILTYSLIWFVSSKAWGQWAKVFY